MTVTAQAWLRKRRRRGIHVVAQAAFDMVDRDQPRIHLDLAAATFTEPGDGFVAAVDVGARGEFLDLPFWNSRASGSARVGDGVVAALISSSRSGRSRYGGPTRGRTSQAKPIRYSWLPRSMKKE